MTDGYDQPVTLPYDALREAPSEVLATIVSSQNGCLYTTFNCPACGCPHEENSFTADELRRPRAKRIRSLRGWECDRCHKEFFHIIVVLDGAKP